MVDFNKAPMTKNTACFIRHWRVDGGFSYRTIAGLTAKLCSKMGIKIHPNGDGYQYEGIDLCDEAAKFFGENAGDEPWN